MYIIVCTIMPVMIAKAINNVYHASLDNPTEGFNGVSTCQLVITHCNNYAQISQPKNDTNMSNFHQGINAALLLTVYMKKQECSQIFALNAGHLPSMQES